MACCAIMLALIPVLFYIILLIFQFCFLNAKLLIFLVVNVEKIKFTGEHFRGIYKSTQCRFHNTRQLSKSLVWQHVVV